MPSQLLSTRLDELHEPLLLISKLRLQTPKDTLIDLIGKATLKPKTTAPLSSKTSPRIRFASGSLQKSFLQLCQKHNSSGNSMIKRLVAAEISQIIAQSISHPNITISESELAPSQSIAVANIGVIDAQRHSIELRLSESELTIIRELAQRRHTSAQRLIVQIIRAYLLNEHAFSSDEIAQLGAINSSLLRIGNNINQIARQKNTNSLKAEKTNNQPKEVDEAPLELNQCLQEIQAYVKTCSQYLQNSRERWHIQLRE